MRSNVFKLSIVVWTAFAACAWAVPYRINHYGTLVDSLGQPLATTEVSMAAAVFDTPIAGNPLYTEPAVTVTTTVDGAYNFEFGADNDAFRAALAVPDAWMEISVDGTPLSPRTKLLAVPYAVLAGNGVVNDTVKFSDGSLLYYDGYDLLFQSKGLTSRIQLAPFTSNLPPVAVSDAASTQTNMPVVIDLLANDTDPNHTDTLTVVSVVAAT